MANEPSKDAKTTTTADRTQSPHTTAMGHQKY